MNIKEQDKQKEKSNADFWLEFYMTFNDDDFQHAESAFFNNHFENDEDIYRANVEWVKEIVNRGITPEKILEYMPDADMFIEDYLANDLLITKKMKK